MWKEMPIAGARTRRVVRNSGKLRASGCGTCVTRPGKKMQGDELRAIEWAPPKEATLLLPIPEPAPEEYGPWQLAGDVGRARGQIGGSAFMWQEDGKLRCPAGASLWLSEVRQENAFTQRAVYLAYQTDCQPCARLRAMLGTWGQRQPSSSGECSPSSLAPAVGTSASADPARTDAMGGCGRP